MKAIDDITRGSLRQTAGILLSFAPLLVFWFISFGHSLIRLQIGAYTGTALLIVLGLTRRSRGAILWAMAIFFAITVIFAAWLKNVWIIRHLGVLPGSLLFAVATLSMILDRPFVLDYARDGVSPALRDSVSFVRACFAMTSFWAAIFLLLALLNVAKMSYPAPGGVTYLVVQLGILVLALAYQVAYTVHVRRRRLAMGNASRDPSHPGI